MKKKEVIEIATALGFKLDLDKFDLPDGWIRFELKPELDEKDLRWIWYKDETLAYNLGQGSQILFKAGQKAFKIRNDTYIDL